MSSLSSWRSLPRGVAAASALALSAAVMSADHAESPGTDADPAADLADVFIFPSPESSAKTVAAITFGGRSAPRSRIDGSFYCDPKVLYTLHIDRADAAGNFDSVPDVEVLARFGKDAEGNCGLQLENVPGAGGVFSGKIETVITSPAGMKAFAGLRNDPSFSTPRATPRSSRRLPAPGKVVTWSARSGLAAARPGGTLSRFAMSRQSSSR
jgi:hypothetical protein